MCHVVVYGFLVSVNLSEILWWLSITFWWNGKSLPSHPLSMALLAMCLQPASAKIQLVHSFTHFVILLIILQSEVCQANDLSDLCNSCSDSSLDDFDSNLYTWFTIRLIHSVRVWAVSWIHSTSTYCIIHIHINQSVLCPDNFDCHISRFTIYSLKATQVRQFELILNSTFEAFI